MIVDRDAQRLRRGDQFAGQGDILPAGFGVSRWVVVDKDQRCRAELDRAPDDLTDMDGRLVDRSFRDEFVANQAILGVQIESYCAYMATG